MEHNYLKDQEIEHMQQSILEHQNKIKKAQEELAWKEKQLAAVNTESQDQVQSIQEAYEQRILEQETSYQKEIDTLTQSQ